MFGFSKIYPIRASVSALKNIPAPLAPRKLSYAAAQDSRLTGDWITLNEDVNSLIGKASPAVRSRPRR